MELSAAVWVSLVAIVVGIPAATYYPFMFGRVQWYKTDIGKSMFTKGIALASIFWVAIGSVGAAAWDWDWYPWVRTVSNCFLVVAVWYQVIVMRRVQRSGMLAEKLSNRPPHDM